MTRPVIILSLLLFRDTFNSSNDELHSILNNLVQDIIESELRTVHTLSGQETPWSAGSTARDIDEPWGHNGLLPNTSVLVDWNRTFILVIWFMVCWRLKFYSINIILHRLWNNTYQIIFFRLHADIFTFLKFHWAIATLITKFF